MSNMESILILDGFTWWLLDIGDHFSAFLQYCVISLQMMHNMQSRPMLEEPCNTVPIEGWSSKNVLLIISVFLQLECIRCADKRSSQQMLLEDASLNTECSSRHTNILLYTYNTSVDHNAIWSTSNLFTNFIASKKKLCLSKNVRKNEYIVSVPI